MCCRFSQTYPAESIQRNFSVEHITCELIPRHEVFPSQQVPAIIMHQSQTRLGLLTWGLVPFWAKERKGPGLINARMETLSEKPSFRESFIKRRCLIIADGYYEWKQPPDKGGKKIRCFFQLPSKEPFAFAGLWNTWRKDHHSCTIITREAVEGIRDIHHRMPAILHPDACHEWLNPENRNPALINSLLLKGCIDTLTFSEGD